MLFSVNNKCKSLGFRPYHCILPALWLLPYVFYGLHSCLAQDIGWLSTVESVESTKFIAMIQLEYKLKESALNDSCFSSFASQLTNCLNLLSKFCLAHIHIKGCFIYSHFFNPDNKDVKVANVGCKSVC